MRLTDIVVQRLAPPAKTSKVYVDDQLTGFGVRVTAGGVKAFVLTYGKTRERVTIGRYPIIGLAEARVEAKRILAERTLGKLRPKRLSFEDALTLFLETRKQKNRPRTVEETEKLLRGYFKPLLRMNLQDIKAHHVADITDALSKRGVQSTAAHAHRGVKTFLKWCAQRQYITANPIAELEMPTLPKTRERILKDDELRKVWRATEKQTPFNTIIRLCMLTGQRRGELSQVVPEWIKGNTLTIPSDVAKNKTTHALPCSDRALSYLHKCPFVFNSWSESKRVLDKRSGVTDWVIHHLRKTYATTLQRLGVKLEVIEQLLNHKSGTRSGIVGVYQKYSYETEMREAVTTYEEWFIKNIVGVRDGS